MILKIESIICQCLNLMTLHNIGVLFLYTVEISQAPFFAHFCPWESKPKGTLHNGTYR